ncbi:VanZ family protein [Kineosporia sp. NBRC 101731]|uniref:VanZ family protein n=1 Tax=Kineosporia sp. NBRC 101731 TaxID=3032199 RepID=UPI0024A60359|nr:VanZ family protein [Kineosporia sp. NBRC 101731]GLY33277.1 hypothetical protein Kisp02_66420 [Kineosporia sp. NBRC 101731]
MLRGLIPHSTGFMALITLIVLVAVACLLRHWHVTRAGRGPVILLALVVLGDLALTVPGTDPQIAPYWDRAPFSTFGGHARTDTEILGNLLMFVPVGALVYLLSRRLFPALALSGGFSFAIELYQYVDRQGRVASTDDVLLNLGGAVIGVLMTLSATRWAGPPDGR